LHCGLLSFFGPCGLADGYNGWGWGSLGEILGPTYCAALRARLLGGFAERFMPKWW
jgi:hypothetical protein